MKLRLFFFLCAILIAVGLLMPVGVYAADISDTDYNIKVTVEDVTAFRAELCILENDTSVEAAVSSDDEVADNADTDADDPCEDGDDSSFRVSWNS